MADIELDNDNATSSFTVSGDFSQFSAAAIEKTREELLADEVRQKFQMEQQHPKASTEGNGTQVCPTYGTP